MWCWILYRNIYLLKLIKNKFIVQILNCWLGIKKIYSKFVRKIEKLYLKVKEILFLKKVHTKLIESDLYLLSFSDPTKILLSQKVYFTIDSFLISSELPSTGETNHPCFQIETEHGLSLWNRENIPNRPIQNH